MIIGGNSKTYLIATISPAKINADESISTLKFADRAKQVMITAKINETRPIDYKMIIRLQNEINLLKKLLNKYLTNNEIENEIQKFHLTENTNELINENKLLNNNNNNETSNNNQLNLHLQGSINNGNGNGNIALNNNSEIVIKYEKLLQIEHKKVVKLQNENELLKNEVNLFHSTSTSTSIVHPTEVINSNESSNILSHHRSPMKHSQNNPINSNNNTNNILINNISNLYNNYNSKIWIEINEINKIMKLFFKFEIEEDSMKKQMDSVSICMFTYFVYLFV